MHELSHGIGPAFARTAKGKMPITEAIGPTYSALEEAKADIVGMFGLDWLMDHGNLPKARANEFYSSYVAGIFRAVRFGVAEAHGRGGDDGVQLSHRERRDYARPVDGPIRDRLREDAGAIASLAKELLEIEATGDRQRAGALVREVRPDAGDAEGNAGQGDERAGRSGSGDIVRRSDPVTCNSVEVLVLQVKGIANNLHLMPSIKLAREAPESGEAKVLAKASLNAASRLGLRHRHLADVIGTSEASVSRLHGGRGLHPETKEGELALLFLRLFRSLDALVGGDDVKARDWVHADNDHVGGVPAERIRTVEGLVDVVQYLDGMRGRL